MKPVRKSKNKNKLLLAIAANLGESIFTLVVTALLIAAILLFLG